MSLGRVRPEHQLDEARLRDWLTTHVAALPGAPPEVLQFDAGQSNPTFLLRWPDRSVVLRKKPPGPLLPRAHAIEREARILRALAQTDVPVPQVLGLCEDATVIGTPFFLMEFLEGRIVWDARCPDQTPDERRAMYAEMVRVLAALHTVDIDAVGLSDFGRRGQYVSRQIRTWTKQYRLAETDPIEAMEHLVTWLPAHAPLEEPVSLAHGDFRIDNLVWHPTEPRIIGVLDWELSTVGNPMADVAYSCLPYLVQTPYHPPIGPMAGSESGIPPMEEHLAAYAEQAGVTEIPDLPFYLAFSLFRIAAILQGVYARGLQGNASSTRALKMGELARGAADAAWTIARSERATTGT